MITLFGSRAKGDFATSSIGVSFLHLSAARIIVHQARSNVFVLSDYSQLSVQMFNSQTYMLLVLVLTHLSNKFIAHQARSNQSLCFQPDFAINISRVSARGKNNEA